MRPVLALFAAMLALALAACGQATSATNFKGEEQAVAQVLDDLRASAEQAKADDICNNLFATAMQERLGAGKSTCGAEMKKALEDADTFDLSVQSVTVAGATASARVKGNDTTRDIIRTFGFAKEGNRWRIVSYGTAG
jgi:hypothetical protein